METVVEKIDVYEKVTNELIAQLEQGTIPWRKTWSALLPQNYASKHTYQGINLILLSMLNYEHPYFLTFKQSQALGGYVKKGAKGHIIIFWKVLQVKDREAKQENKTKQVPFLRYSHVFNVADVEGIDFEFPQVAQRGNKPIEACGQIVAAMPNAPRILFENPESAFYSPSRDIVNMPPITRFENSEEYYATLFHELTHATGHYSRLDREGFDEMGRFGSPVYSREELIAEFGAAFLCQVAGIQNCSLIENSAAYLRGWLRVLRNDKRLLIEAASKAQRAVDLILNRNETAETIEH